MANPIIRVENLNFSFGRKAVFKNLNFSMEEGETLCLFGESGIGKSTIVKLICGLLKPDGGKIFVGTNNFRVVFQEDRLLPFLTVRENAGMFGTPESSEALIEDLGLSDAADLYPNQLSGGMARRAALARALAGKGDIYIFDEPFNGMDEENIKKSALLIEKYTEGKTVIFVLHDKEEAVKLGCRIIEIS